MHNKQMFPFEGNAVLWGQASEVFLNAFNLPLVEIECPTVVDYLQRNRPTTLHNESKFVFVDGIVSQGYLCRSESWKHAYDICDGFVLGVFCLKQAAKAKLKRVEEKQQPGYPTE